MLNKQTFLNILEMIFINLNSTENFLLNKLIQLILLVYESYIRLNTNLDDNLTVNTTVPVNYEVSEDIQLNKTNSEHKYIWS